MLAIGCHDSNYWGTTDLWTSTASAGGVLVLRTVFSCFPDLAGPPAWEENLRMNSAVRQHWNSSQSGKRVEQKSHAGSCGCGSRNSRTHIRYGAFLANYAARFCPPDICLTTLINSCFAESSLKPGVNCQALTPAKVSSCGPNAMTLTCGCVRRR